MSGGRVWKTGNLLAEFDNQGIVKRLEPFHDSRAVQVLAPVAENTLVLLDAPIEMSVTYWKNGAVQVPARIVLSREKLNFEELGEQKKKHIFSVPAKDLRKMGLPRILGGTDPTYAGRRIECARDLKKLGGPRGKDINLQLTTPQLVTLMRYFGDGVAGEGGGSPPLPISVLAFPGRGRPSASSRTRGIAPIASTWPRSFWK